MDLKNRCGDEKKGDAVCIMCGKRYQRFFMGVGIWRLKDCGGSRGIPFLFAASSVAKMPFRPVCRRCARSQPQHDDQPTSGNADTAGATAASQHPAAGQINQR